MENEENEEKKRGFTIGAKVYIFVTSVVLAVALGTAAFSFLISADQIDSYFKRLAKNCAENYASFADADYLSTLRETAESEEFQALRDQAEEDDDDTAIQEYLEEHGLWEKYEEQRELMRRYLSTMEDLEYLYLVVWGDADEMYDMYLIDADDVPIYQTGYYEEREAEFEGVSPDTAIEPVISHGPWGWLCSAYTPIRDKSGHIVCHVGCDVDMENIMTERGRFLIYLAVAALVFAAIVLVLSILFSRRVIVKPLRRLTNAAQEFRPAEGSDYKEAGVMDLSMKGSDEIVELYGVIRSMQINIVDYINDLSHVQRENLRNKISLSQAKSSIRAKDEQIGQISRVAYRDSLTGLGNKTSYVKKVEEINQTIIEGDAAFGVVIMDINDLKLINDSYGHKSGDAYIKGCSHILCEIYKHSPVYRIGGDEFVAILQGTDYENRYILLDEARTAFSQTAADSSAEPWHRYSAAVGMAEYASDDSTVEFVFKRADKSMYENKAEYKKQHGSYR